MLQILPPMANPEPFSFDFFISFRLLFAKIRLITPKMMPMKGISIEIIPKVKAFIDFLFTLFF